MVWGTRTHTKPPQNTKTKPLSSSHSPAIRPPMRRGSGKAAGSGRAVCGGRGRARPAAAALPARPSPAAGSAAGGERRYRAHSPLARALPRSRWGRPGSPQGHAGGRGASPAGRSGKAGAPSTACPLGSPGGKAVPREGVGGGLGL